MTETYYLDGRRFRDSEATYDYLVEVFSLPAYFGRNLDALYDSLANFEDTEVKLEHARYLPGQLGDYGLKLLDVFGDLSKEGHIRLRMEW